MRLLAIETSGSLGSVAALEEGKCVGQLLLHAKQRSAQSLAPGIASLVKDQLDWTLKSIDCIAVSVGPGSFTGLRVGVATAKTLAYVIGAQVVGVNTLQTIASQSASVENAPNRTANSGGRVWAVIDAGRQQLYAAAYDLQAVGVPREIRPTQIVGYQCWLNQLELGDSVTGPGLERVRDQLPLTITLTDEASWIPQANMVGTLGYTLHQTGKCDSPWGVKPFYLRISAAEEKREAAQEGG